MIRALDPECGSRSNHQPTAQAAAPVDTSALGWVMDGADVTGAEAIWIAVIGPDTPALGERAHVARVTQSQIAATIASLLGESYTAADPSAAQPLPVRR